MKTLISKVSYDKNKQLKENVVKKYTDKEGVEKTITSTTEDVVIMGVVDTVYTDIENPWGEARTSIKLAGDTNIDPVYNIPIQEDPVYVNFDSSSGQYPSTKAEDTKKLNIKEGSYVLIKAKKESQTNEEGQTYVNYSGVRVQYAGSAKPVELRAHSIFVIPGTSVLKKDHILVYVKGWDRTSKSEYTCKVKAYPADGNFSEELQAAFAKSLNAKGEMKNPQAVFVVPADDYKLTYKNGKPVDGEMKFTSYELIPKASGAVPEAVGTEEATA